MLTKTFGRNKGAALLTVLATLLVLVILATAAMRLMLSQGTLSRHQYSRTRAYYAAQAGMVYTLEMLRGGDWTPPPGGSRKYCISRDGACPGHCPPGPCQANVVDPDMPYPVQITLNAYGPTPAGPNEAAINIRVDYSAP